MIKSANLNDREENSEDFLSEQVYGSDGTTNPH